jgi:glycosyltransferase involved in cell wall biosynthesis
VSWRRWLGLRQRGPAAPLALPETTAGVRALHIGGYWRGPNDMVRQMMLGLRAAGAQVLELNTDERPDLLDTEGRPYLRGTTCPVWLRVERLRAELRRHEPNLIICNAGGLGLRPADAARLRKDAFLLGIALSDPDTFEPSTRHIAPQFDAFLTNAPLCVPRYVALGVPSAVLPIATNEEFFHPVATRAEMLCDTLVLGRAHPDRVEPVRALLARFDTHVYGEGWEQHGVASRGVIQGDDVLAALSSARTSVVFFRTLGGYSLVKVGLFDFAAAGALVVTNRSAEVDPYLIYGREIVGFSSTEDLLAQVAHYLTHPDEAERIRRAGRERVLRDHTWRVAWPRILARLRSLRSLRSQA